MIPPPPQLQHRYEAVWLRFLPAIALFLPLCGSSTSHASTIGVNPGISTSQINSVIASSAPGDTIDWQAGDYVMQSRDEHYVFIGDRNYHFDDGVNVTTTQTEAGYVFNVIGSNVNIAGTGSVAMRHKKIGVIGSYSSGNRDPSLLTNINISGITSYASDVHYEWQNLTNTAQERTSPDIHFANTILMGGNEGFHFNYAGKDIDGKTPYLSLDNITANGLTTMLIELPIRDDTGTFVDGQHYITRVALMNSNALVTPQLYPVFTSPRDLAQQNVTNPYVNPAKNDFVTGDMKFVSGTLVPQHDSPLNLGEGQYIGAYVPEGTAETRRVSFALAALNDLHTMLSTSDLTIEFGGTRICLPNGDAWKLDLKYAIEYCIDDHDPNTPDQVLASTVNHVTLDFASAVDTVSLPLDPQDLMIGPGTWDIYARVHSLASDGLDLGLPADLETYFGYLQFAAFDSDRVTVTGLPEPATLGLLALGGCLLVRARRRNPCSGIRGIRDASRFQTT